MKKFKGDIVVGSIVVAGFMWFGINSEILNKNNLEKPIDETEDKGYIDIRSFSKNYIKQKDNDFYHEFKKEEEKQRLIALHNERIKQLDIERKAEEERLRKLEEARKLREKEKREVVVSRGEQREIATPWKTFEATYYSAFCDTCSGTGKTASGVSVANSIYYKGYRVIATNTNEIPMWSIVEVKTHYGTFKAVALDTGGFGRNAIDILVDSTKTAYKLGRHDVQVRVLGKLKY